MNHAGRLTGLVLAGGRSSRMGCDKSRLPWHGQPLYQHMLSLLKRSGVDQTLVSGQGFEAPSVADRIPGRGPLSGIDGALRVLPDGDRLLVVPVDMPRLPEEALRRLGNERQLCHFTGHSLPLLIPVNPPLRQAVHQAISSENPKDYALWRLCQGLNGHKIPLPESMSGGFGNANTPADWQQCIEHRSK